MTKQEKKDLLVAIEFTYGNNRSKVLGLRRVINSINKPVETTNEQPKFTNKEYHIICNAIEKCHGDENDIARMNMKMNKLCES